MWRVTPNRANQHFLILIFQGATDHSNRKLQWIKIKNMYIVSLKKLFNLLKTTPLAGVLTSKSYRYGVYSYVCIYQLNIEDFVVGRWYDHSSTPCCSAKTLVLSFAYAQLFLCISIHKRKMYRLIFH